MRGGDLLKFDKDQIIKYVDELKTNIEKMPVTEPEEDVNKSVVGNTEVESVVGNTEEGKPVVESEVGNIEKDNIEKDKSEMLGGRKKSQKRKQRKNRKSQRRQKRR